MVDGFGGPSDLCHLIMERCVGNYSQFESYKHCYEYMATLPKFKLGWCPILAGNTLSCRWTHAILSHEKMRPDIHCYHLGRAELMDPNGKLKCHDRECGGMKGGPIECDKGTCDGIYMPAGQWVDDLHIVYWGFMLALALYAAWQTRGKVRDLEKVKGDGTEHVLDSMKRLYPLIQGFVVVSFFFFLVFLVVRLSHVAFLWRPWPAQSIAPRFNEIQQSSTTRKALYLYADYAGERTEHVLSSLNLYQMQHLIFYVLLTATFCLAMAIEWAGARLHAKGLPGWLSFDLSQVGHAAFTAFVCVALYFDESAFSYVLFLIGLTKCMYPEICMSLWFAYVKQEERAWVRYEMTKAWRGGTFKLDLPEEASLRAEATTIQRRQERNNLLLRTSKLVNKMSAGGIASENININAKIDLTFSIHFLCGCGIMLHHFSLIMIFIASSLDLLFTEDYAFAHGLTGILFLVLFQHVVGQIVVGGLLKLGLLTVNEIFFQWFAISALADAGGSIGTVGTLGLMASHFLMAPEVPYTVIKGYLDDRKDDGALAVGLRAKSAAARLVRSTLTAVKSIPEVMQTPSASTAVNPAQWGPFRRSNGGD